MAGWGSLTQQLHQGVIHGRTRGLQDEHVGVADILAQLDVALPVVEAPRVCLEDTEALGSWEEECKCAVRSEEEMMMMQVKRFCDSDLARIW